jgi:microcystin-dependent protein
MASTATTRNRLNKQGTGDNSGTWGGVLNAQVFDIVDEALDGVTTLTISGNVTLTSTNYVTDQARRRMLKLTGSPGASYTITIPSVEKFYFVINQSDAAQTIKTSGGVGYSVPAGEARTVACDGTDCFGPSSAVPYVIGAVMSYAAGLAGAPSGWLFCYGQAVSRATYAALFGAIGTYYGTGDGSTTFNVPDCRGRVDAGKDDMGGVSANRLTNQSGGLNGDTLGATGGSETHTLTTAQIPAHNHDYDRANNESLSNSIDIGALNDTARVFQSTSHTSTSSETIGDGGAHNNVQPTIIFTKIIYAGV